MEEKPVSCVKLEEQVFESPLRILGVSEAEVMEIYAAHRDEKDFKRQLRKLFYPRIHTDKYESILQAVASIGGPELAAIFRAVISSRLKRADEAVEEIWKQLRTNRKVSDRWVYRRRP